LWPRRSPASSPTCTINFSIWRASAERTRAHFAAATSKAALETTATILARRAPESARGLPPSRACRLQDPGQVEADDYVIEKLVLESFSNYFVSALLYKPRTIKRARCPASSALWPLARRQGGGPYQMLHINLVKRGYVVLTYDPVGQGEQPVSDAQKAEVALQLTCGDTRSRHPLYLLGQLARYRSGRRVVGQHDVAALDEIDVQHLIGGRRLADGRVATGADDAGHAPFDRPGLVQEGGHEVVGRAFKDELLDDVIVRLDLAQDLGRAARPGSAATRRALSGASRARIVAVSPAPPSRWPREVSAAFFLLTLGQIEKFDGAGRAAGRRTPGHNGEQKETEQLSKRRIREFLLLSERFGPSRALFTSLRLLARVPLRTASLSLPKGKASIRRNNTLAQ